MAQQELDPPEIDARIEELGGKRMPERISTLLIIRR